MESKIKKNIDYYVYVEIPEREPFVVVVRHLTVVQASWRHRWMLRKSWDVVRRWLKRKKAKINVKKKQYYL